MVAEVLVGELPSTTMTQTISLDNILLMVVQATYSGEARVLCT